MNRLKRLTGKKMLLTAMALCAFGFAKAQTEQTTQNTLTLTLDKALEIALDENPTIKVAAEEIALKKVASKEAWQSLLPEASLNGSLDHTIKAAEMKLNDMSFKMGQDGTNTANAGLSINLPLFVPGVYRAMSMTKTDIELAVEKSRASKLDLVNQVSKAYYQLMLAQDSYEVLQGSYKLAEDNYNVVNAKYQQGTVSEYDKISAEVQMRSIKPNLISAANAVTLAKLQLKVLMGITADVEIKINDSLTNYETAMFANQLREENVNLDNNTTMKQLDCEAVQRKPCWRSQAMVRSRTSAFCCLRRGTRSSSRRLSSPAWAVGEGTTLWPPKRSSRASSCGCPMARPSRAPAIP